MANTGIQTSEKKITRAAITPSELLEQWQGHRRLTRRVIEAFPNDKLFNYSIGGMRTFFELTMEFIRMAEPGITGVATGEWKTADELMDHPGKIKPQTKLELLQRWDEITEKINSVWPGIPTQRFGENDIAFGQWEGKVYSFVLYFIDNEIHHRGQGYVYLRSLGIEPPPFWERN